MPKSLRPCVRGQFWGTCFKFSFILISRRPPGPAVIFLPGTCAGVQAWGEIWSQGEIHSSPLIPQQEYSLNPSFTNKTPNTPTRHQTRVDHAYFRIGTKRGPVGSRRKNWWISRSTQECSVSSHKGLFAVVFFPTHHPNVQYHIHFIL